MAPDQPIPGSVSRLFDPLRKGDPAAVAALWPRFYTSLVEVAARRLDDALHAAIGPEDVAQEALLEFCRALALPGSEERFPRLGSRRELWSLLVCFTVRRACDVRRKFGLRVGVVAGESALGEAGLEQCQGREPPPDFASALEELLSLLPEDLRQVALLRLEGRSNEEIAGRIKRSVKTVEVKLQAIRAVLKPRLESP